MNRSHRITTVHRRIEKWEAEIFYSCGDHQREYAERMDHEPNYSEILRFHDFGDMLLKINTVLSYLENSRAGAAELPEFHSLQDSGFGKRQRAFIFCRYSAHSITAGRGSSGVRTEGRGILEVRWKLCAWWRRESGRQPRVLKRRISHGSIANL